MEIMFAPDFDNAAERALIAEIGEKLITGESMDYERVQAVLMSEYGGRYLGSGIGRIAYRVGNMVFKISRHKSYIDCAREWGVYNAALKHGISGYLARVYALFRVNDVGWINVMEYVEQTHRRYSEEHIRSHESTVKATFKEFLDAGFFVTDLHFGNVIGGKVVDYGVFETPNMRD